MWAASKWTVLKRGIQLQSRGSFCTTALLAVRPILVQYTPIPAGRKPIYWPLHLSTQYLMCFFPSHSHSKPSPNAGLTRHPSAFCSRQVIWAHFAAACGSDKSGLVSARTDYFQGFHDQIVKWSKLFETVLHSYLRKKRKKWPHFILGAINPLFSYGGSWCDSKSTFFFPPVRPIFFIREIEFYVQYLKSWSRIILGVITSPLSSYGGWKIKIGGNTPASPFLNKHF